MNRTLPTSDDDKFTHLIGESFDRQPIPSRPPDRQTMDDLAAKQPPIVNAHPSRWSHPVTSVPVLAVGILMAIVIWRVDPDEGTDVTKDDKTIVARQVEDIPNTTPAQQKPVVSRPYDDPARQESNDHVAESEPAKEIRYGLKKYSVKTVAEDLKTLLEQHKAIVTADLRTNTVTILGTDEERRLAKEYIAQLHRKPKDQKDGDDYAPSIVSIVEYVRNCVENQKTDPQKLALCFGSYLPTVTPERNTALISSFESLGIPKSIRSIKRGVLQKHKWLATDNCYAYTCTMDYEHLWTDVEAFVDTAVGDEITQDMLDGIRDDEEGPKIDMRKIIKTFEEDFVLVVHASDRPGIGEKVMVAMPLTDTALVTRAVERVMAIEPDQTNNVVGGVTVHIIQRDDGPARATCIANNCLLSGDLEMVRASIRRLKNR